MKEAFANVATRERQQVLTYLKQVQQYLETESEKATEEVNIQRYDDQAFLVEMLIDKLEHKRDNQSMSFSTLDLGE